MISDAVINKQSRPCRGNKGEVMKKILWILVLALVLGICFFFLSTDKKPEGCVTVTVDYDLSIFTIARGYDRTDEPIENGDFQAEPRNKGKVTKEVCWFKFAQVTSSEDAQAKISASGEFLVADLWELNALGSAKSNHQFPWEINALGSEEFKHQSSLYVYVIDSEEFNFFPLVALGSRWRDPLRRRPMTSNQSRSPTTLSVISKNEDLISGKQCGFVWSPQAP